MQTPGAGNKHRDSSFKVDEWLEALLRCRDEQPRRYAREVSPGLQVKVERYAAQKRAHTERKAA
jgi:hypothetical protein